MYKYTAYIQIFTSTEKKVGMHGMHYAGQFVLRHNAHLMWLFTTHHPETRIQHGNASYHWVIGNTWPSRCD